MPRQLIWQSMTHAANIADGVVNATMLIDQSVDEMLADCTIVRYRADIHVSPTDGAGTANGCVYIGLRIIDVEAYTAAGLNMPNLQGDPDADWLFWRGFHCAQGGVTVSASESAFAGVIDNRSQRKMMGRNKGLVSVCLNSVGNGIELDIHGRALVMLH